jgi:hypothetical protein
MGPACLWIAPIHIDAFQRWCQRRGWWGWLGGAGGPAVFSDPLRGQTALTRAEQRGAGHGRGAAPL